MAADTGNPDDVCPGCQWRLGDLGPPMGRSTIPDLGGWCCDCAPCTKCGAPAGDCTCIPEYMYREGPEGTVLRSKVIGVDPDWGFPLTLDEWEQVPSDG